MTIAAYQTLFHGSVLFGIQKQAQTEKGIPELTKKLSDLEYKKNVLANEVGPEPGFFLTIQT